VARPRATASASCGCRSAQDARTAARCCCCAAPAFAPALAASSRATVSARTSAACCFASAQEAAQGCQLAASSPLALPAAPGLPPRARGGPWLRGERRGRPSPARPALRAQRPVAPPTQLAAAPASRRSAAHAATSRCPTAVRAGGPGAAVGQSSQSHAASQKVGQPPAQGQGPRQQ